MPSEIAEVVADFDLEGLGFQVEWSGNGLDLTHPTMAGKQWFGWPPGEPPHEQVGWLRATLRNWKELSLAADAPASAREAELLRIIRGCAVTASFEGGAKAVEGAMVVAEGLSEKGLLSGDQVMWLRDAVAGDLVEFDDQPDLAP